MSGSVWMWIAVLAIGLLAGAALGAAGEREDASVVSLAPTLVTEGAAPVTEVEATISLAKSRTDRTYELALSSLQYAPVRWFGLKLAVPFTLVEPRDGPAVAGPGDMSLLAKWAPVLLPARQLAVSAGLLSTFPTGSERRGLGGTLAVGPIVAVGKGFGPASLQADASYAWQLNQPRSIEPDEPGGESVRLEREQVAAANLTATYTVVDGVAVIVELNGLTRVRGEELRDRVQLSLTPGLSVDLVPGWNLRGGVQVPLTSAKEFDYNVLVLLTREF